MRLLEFVVPRLPSAECYWLLSFARQHGNAFKDVHELLRGMLYHRLSCHCSPWGKLHPPHRHKLVALRGFKHLSYQFLLGDGLLLAALYHPVWTSAIFAPLDFALALAAFLVLMFWDWAPWLVVILSAVAASLLA